MNAKSIYDNLVDVQGIPSSILTYSDKEDCIIIEIQDYNKSVFKFAKEFFKGYKSTDIIYTNENKTVIWYNEVSVYSDRETIQAITDFYYRAKVKGLVESKKSTRKSKDITIEEFISNYKNNDCFSIRDKENGHESECFWGSKKDVLDSDYRLFTVLDTDVNKETDDIILYIDLEENAWVESKKFAIKSIKEGRIDKGAIVYEFTCLLNRLGYSGVDYSNEENNEKCDDIVYMIIDLLKTMPRL